MSLVKPTESYYPNIVAALVTLGQRTPKVVRLATAAALATNAYVFASQTLTATANASLTVDGIAVAVGDHVLVANEAAASNNGIYVVTQVGDGSHPYILTRAPEMNAKDSTDLVSGTLVATGPEGIANANAIFMLATAAPFTIDSTALVFVKASSALEAAAPLATFCKTAADGAAANATAETVLGMVGPSSGGTIGFCYYVPAAALTFNASNFATLQVQKRTAGGGAVTVAQLATTAASWTQWNPVLIPVVAGAVAKGDALTFNIAKTGSGVIVPAGQLNVYAS